MLRIVKHPEFREGSQENAKVPCSRGHVTHNKPASQPAARQPAQQVIAVFAQPKKGKPDIIFFLDQPLLKLKVNS
jgi:hypothetical protein